MTTVVVSVDQVKSLSRVKDWEIGTMGTMGSVVGEASGTRPEVFRQFLFDEAVCFASGRHTVGVHLSCIGGLWVRCVLQCDVSKFHPCDIDLCGIVFRQEIFAVGRVFGIGMCAVVVVDDGKGILEDMDVTFAIHDHCLIIRNEGIELLTCGERLSGCDLRWFAGRQKEAVTQSAESNGALSFVEDAGYHTFEHDALVGGGILRVDFDAFEERVAHGFLSEYATIEVGIYIVGSDKGKLVVAT